jgi:hypothetical protein
MISARKHANRAAIVASLGTSSAAGTKGTSGASN